MGSTNRKLLRIVLFFSLARILNFLLSNKGGFRGLELAKNHREYIVSVVEDEYVKKVERYIRHQQFSSRSLSTFGTADSYTYGYLAINSKSKFVNYFKNNSIFTVQFETSWSCRRPDVAAVQDRHLLEIIRYVTRSRRSFRP